MSAPMQNPCKDVVTTDADWIAILEAYVAWLKGEGPPVQRLLGDDWLDWTSSYRISKDNATSGRWRVRPQPWRSRIFYRRGAPIGQPLVGAIIWYPGDEEPTISSGSEWLGDWVDTPGTDQ